MVLEAENQSTQSWKSFQEVAISAQSLGYKYSFVVCSVRAGVQHRKIKMFLYGKLQNLTPWAMLPNTYVSTNSTSSTTVLDACVFGSCSKQRMSEIKFFWVYHQSLSVEGKN